MTLKTLASPLPVIVAILAIFLLSIMDAAIKTLTSSFPTAEIVFLRYLSGLFVAMAVFAGSGVALPSRQGLGRAALRAVTILVTAGFFFHTLSLLPLAEAVAITFTAPLFLTLLGRLILGEPVSRHAALAIALGFAGLGIMFAGRIASETTSGEPIGYLYGLIASFSYSLATILSRKDSAHDHVIVMVTAQHFFVTAFSLPFTLSVFVMPHGHDLLFFALIGLLGASGHFALVWAYAHAPASRLAPIEFTSLLWAPLFGLVFFAERPTMPTIAGAALIVAAATLVIRQGSQSDAPA
ncbi:carboxylate/amino acid/amine transporter [Hartmannibacter diazotrophicus]|uniref:Carboxylate/amino acid/amine transporter n=1 Tax=Hartmannibacter diazotrophicus TaxID=1482074 RepID=A0A2C9D2X2_9HYPH|nr:DMT family transporter [Hartmannibacter diazotrophicus]SON54614.1 carboxylate/amino acid/amine transporter [Hartmannibacter diazotrophicus]